MKTLLLTWWTWYIGSHTAVALLEQGYSVIIIDNLSNSSEDVIEKIEQIVTPPVASDIPLYEGEQNWVSLLEGDVWKIVLSPSKREMPVGQREYYWYQPGTEILFSDTIWFIRDLPPELINAFASTLEDSIESDILFHVVDASDPKVDEKIQVVDDILERIGANQKRIYIFNKIDKISGYELIELKKRFRDKKPLYISVEKQKGFDQIIQNMLDCI